jgi:hypothetical protein
LSLQGIGDDQSDPGLHKEDHPASSGQTVAHLTLERINPGNFLAQLQERMLEQRMLGALSATSIQEEEIASIAEVSSSSPNADLRSSSLRQQNPRPEWSGSFTPRGSTVRNKLSSPALTMSPILSYSSSVKDGVKVDSTQQKHENQASACDAIPQLPATYKVSMNEASHPLAGTMPTSCRCTHSFKVHGNV